MIMKEMAEQLGRELQGRILDSRHQQVRLKTRMMDLRSLFHIVDASKT